TTGLKRKGFSQRPCRLWEGSAGAHSWAQPNSLVRLKVPRKNVTTRIADFVAANRFEDIPAAVLETAKAHILDGIATMIAGAREEASLRIRRYVIGLGGAREATIVGTRIKIAARYAALANGVQGHVLDYDDTQLATSAKIPFGQLTHPTTPVLAAALALA